MAITASAFRSNIYRLLDSVVEKGEPLSIERKGHLLKVICEDQPRGKLAQLSRHACIEGDPEAIVHTDWSGEWQHDLP